MAHEFPHPILGQEAVVSYGVGRVKAYKDDFPHQWIEIETYADGVSRKYAPHNVRLVPLQSDATNNRRASETR